MEIKVGHRKSIIPVKVIKKGVEENACSKNTFGNT